MRKERRTGPAWLTDGRARCTRIAHPYQWIHGWVLDGCAPSAVATNAVKGWIDELESLASRTGMRELLLRAYVHRARRATRGLGCCTSPRSGVDNPSAWRTKACERERALFVTRSITRPCQGGAANQG